MTEGSGTSAQITGLLASINPTADDELTATDEFLEDTRLLDILELELVVGNEELVDEPGEETGVEDTEAGFPQGAPLIAGISAAAEPLVP